MFKFSRSFLTCIMLGISTASLAMPVAYELSGDASFVLRAVVDDPVADLFGIARANGNITTAPYTLRFVIDTENVPYVDTDTSTTQLVNYRDAIVSATLKINGVVFKTLRRPQPVSTTTPNNEDESYIIVRNEVSTSGFDSFSMEILATQGSQNLLNKHIVPFNQTINGVLYENAQVSIVSIQVGIVGIELLDGVALPTGNTIFDIDNASVFIVGAQLRIDFSPTFVNVTDVISRTNNQFKIVSLSDPEPEPDPDSLLLQPAVTLFLWD